MVDEPDEHFHYSQRSNWLRAGLLGAIDGLTSTAGLIMTFGSAGTSRKTIFLAGIAGLISGALSMAIGELLSVWSTRDSERADIRQEIEMQNAGSEARLHELYELRDIYVERGMSMETAESAAREMSDKDVIKTHARDELGIDTENLTNPYSAAFSSAISFCVGATVPLLAAVFIRSYVWRLISIAIASMSGLLVAGIISAILSGSQIWIVTLRIGIGGGIVLAASWAIGQAFQ